MEMMEIESAGNDGGGGSERKTCELCLYIAGSSPRSQQAVSNVKKICRNSLNLVCDLIVVDILQQPQIAKEDQIIAVPTLIKKLPKPIRLFVGDMSNEDYILRVLEA